MLRLDKSEQQRHKDTRKQDREACVVQASKTSLIILQTFPAVFPEGSLYEKNKLLYVFVCRRRQPSSVFVPAFNNTGTRGLTESVIKMSAGSWGSVEL